jgi:tRNA A-37 threonylcarbamoyl transferase component Bud32
VSNILSCPACAAVILPQEAGEFCPKCRTPLPQSAIDTVMPEDLPGMDDATRLAPEARTASGPGAARRAGDRSSRDSRPSSSTGWLSSSGAIDHGRFQPGALLGGRYRIIERLGRGGMGEVYRADDLKLGQPVALKFLPPDVDKDPARLTQLHTEVRMARLVSHPNVCRVYDIDEIDGTTFLSMEYVDGEDLSSLLKRIGRFPEDRALEIARQICAGLGAAHERDVIHRDLKPANVMLDGAGKVRLTDFGLAGASGEAIRAGTPAYMAPEQIAGQDVTARSDIYALGLVLYELFTGQRALEAKNLAELIHKREQSGITPPTAIVKTLDVTIERTILRCLRPQVEERPSSALAVAAALPGGDPLAAALAAGETPSPAMVAAAGSRDALSLRATAAAAAWIVLSVVVIVLVYQRVILLNRVPLPKPPEALLDRVQEALASLGYDPANVDSASGLGLSLDYARFVEATSSAPNRWHMLRTVRPETFFLWYRTSPQLLVPWGSEHQIGRANPPLTTAGMTLVAVDANGRLSEFHAVPHPRPSSTPVKPADWKVLFAAAGLDPESFVPAAPTIVPPFYADERRAWEGRLPDRPEHPIRIEAATAAGQPVYFALAGPWSASGREARTTPSVFARVIGGLASIIMPGLMVVGAVLARGNIKAGRGDREGAFRVASFVFGASLLAWVLGASHIPSPGIEIGRIFAAARPRDVRSRRALGHLSGARALRAPARARQHSRLEQARRRTLARPEGWRGRHRGRERRAGDDAPLRRPQRPAAARRVPRTDAARFERVVAERRALHPRGNCQRAHGRRCVGDARRRRRGRIRAAAPQSHIGDAGRGHVLHARRHRRNVPGQHAVARRRHRRRNHLDLHPHDRAGWIAVGRRGALHAFRPAARTDHDRLPRAGMRRSASGTWGLYWRRASARATTRGGATRGASRLPDLHADRCAHQAERLAQLVGQEPLV